MVGYSGQGGVYTVNDAALPKGQQGESGSDGGRVESLKLKEKRIRATGRPGRTVHAPAFDLPKIARYIREARHRPGGRKKSKGKKPPNITYRCNNQARRTGIVCNNREVNRDYLETFVLEQIEQSIFNERMADVILTQFESYLRDKDKEMNQTIRRLEEQVKQKDTERSKWVKAIAESETSHQRQIAMKEMERIDDEKADLQKRIEKEKEAIELNIPDRSELQECYQKAQEMFRTRTLTNMKTLIDLYVEKVIVHEDEVEVILNLVPLLYRQNFTNDTRKIKRNRLRDDYGKF